MILKRCAALALCGALLMGVPASAAGPTFPDVSLEYWAFAEIEQASAYGLISGLDDGTFRPEETMNRAQFLTILQRMFQWPTVTPAVPSFADCPPTEWYYAAAETAKAQGILDETALLQPRALVSRAEMAVLLVRALGYEALAQNLATGPSAFPDVTEHSGHIALAAAIGMTNGIEKNGQVIFQPNSLAKRGEAASMLTRVYTRYTSKIDWLHGFYALSSYKQLAYTDQMDGVSVGWARMEFSPETGLSINQQRTSGNEWVRPEDSDLVTDHWAATQKPYNLNVYGNSSKNITLADGTTTSLLDTILLNPARRTEAVALLAAASADYSGLTIDFEALKGDAMKVGLVQLMTELKAALPAGKTLYICVQPGPWYTGFDFKGLGEVCDKVILMAHDYQWSSVPDDYVGLAKTSSPVTPFPSMYAALSEITNAQTGVQDRSKIALAISFGTMGLHVDAEGKLLDTSISHPAFTTISTRLAQPDTTVTYDDLLRNPCARYTAEDGEHYVLWYEDARSVADKLTLARMFGISGISIWRIGAIPNDQTAGANYAVWDAILAQR